MWDYYAIIGTSYKYAPADFREQLYLDGDDRQCAYQDLSALGFSDVMILATCDRVEIHCVLPDLDRSLDQIEGWLLHQAHLSKTQASGHIFRKVGDAALLHLFEIACALDSQIIGETHIIKQLKIAAQESLLDTHNREGVLRNYLESAFALAKRVRNETRIGEGVVSTASAAIKLTTSILGPVDPLKMLIIGLHETGILLGQQFKQAGCGSISMTGPARRTERYAYQQGHYFTPYDLTPTAIAEFDIILTCLGSGRIILTNRVMRDSLAYRRHRPQILIDCGVPRDCDADIAKLDAAFIYSLEDIEKRAEKGQADRTEAADRAKALVAAALIDFRRLETEKDALPVWLALKTHFEATRHAILDAHPGISANEATRLLVNRLLHNPARNLREIAGHGGVADLKDQITVNRILNQVFGLSPSEKNSPVAKVESNQ